MSSIYGNILRLSIFGQSHSGAIGCSIDGIPAGIALDMDRLRTFLDRRAPGHDMTSTARREADRPEFIAGITDGHTNGAPVAAIIRNRDAHAPDYDELRRIPRPGHADWPAQVKFRGFQDVTGGGHFSGRLTAPLCIAGGIALQALETRGIRIAAHILSLGPEAIADAPLDPMRLDADQIKAIAGNFPPCINASAAEAMRARILDARSDLDSVGGMIECVAYGVPAGLGDPIFDGMENRIARIAFGIPSVKGVEFGEGMHAAELCGSTNNDAYRMKDGQVSLQSNHAGGILGGITTGLPIVWRMAVKPTPSIGREQCSVDLEAHEDADLSVRGRHDPCIVPRAVPVAEAACALALLDALLESSGTRI